MYTIADLYDLDHTLAADYLKGKSMKLPRHRFAQVIHREMVRQSRNIRHALENGFKDNATLPLETVLQGLSVREAAERKAAKADGEKELSGKETEKTEKKGTRKKTEKKTAKEGEKQTDKKTAKKAGEKKIEKPAVKKAEKKAVPAVKINKKMEKEYLAARQKVTGTLRKTELDEEYKSELRRNLKTKKIDWAKEMADEKLAAKGRSAQLNEDPEGVVIKVILVDQMKKILKKYPDTTPD